MRQIKKPNSFLVEIIIVTLFFSLCVVMTLQLFVSAHTKTVLSSEKNFALMQAQSICEQIRGLDDQTDLSEVVDGAVLMQTIGNRQSYEIGYDRDYQRTQQSDAIYTATIILTTSQTDQGEMKNIVVQMMQNQKDQVLTKVSTALYLPQK